APGLNTSPYKTAEIQTTLPVPEGSLYLPFEAPMAPGNVRGGEVLIESSGLYYMPTAPAWNFSLISTPRLLIGDEVAIKLTSQTHCSIYFREPASSDDQGIGAGYNPTQGICSTSRSTFTPISPQPAYNIGDFLVLQRTGSQTLKAFISDGTTRTEFALPFNWVWGDHTEWVVKFWVPQGGYI